MSAQFGAKIAAVRSVAEKLFDYRLGTLAGLVATAVILGGCLPTTTPLVGGDPADPGAKVAGVGYRSTVTPYTSLRPTIPSPWRKQRNPAAAPKSGE